MSTVIKTTSINIQPMWILCAFFILLLFIIIYNYLRSIIDARNESEYRDIIEYQTTLLGHILAENPNVLPTISKLRFFPDKSGFFIVLNYEGKILSHGDYKGEIKDSTTVPFQLPTREMVEIAKNGGGYIRYNYKGYIYQSFVYSLPTSPYIVCSGLFTDIHHIEKRRNQWKRVDKVLFKQPRCGVNMSHNNNLQMIQRQIK